MRKIQNLTTPNSLTTVYILIHRPLLIWYDHGKQKFNFNDALHIFRYFRHIFTHLESTNPAVFTF